MNKIKLNTCSKIFYGSQYTSKMFKDLMVDSESNYKILSPGDIEDYYINWESLKNVNITNEKKYEKFELKYGDVIIKCKTSKVRIGVIDKETNYKIIPIGGILVIRVDPQIINPKFLKMYLESKEGKELIKSIQKGNVILTINIKDLGELEIPNVDISIQNELVIEYQKKIYTLKEYEEKVDIIEDELDCFYDKIN